MKQQYQHSRDTVNMLIRVFLVPLTVYYGTFGVEFYMGTLTVLQYHIALASPVFWGTAYLVASLLTLCAVLLRSTGTLIRVALAANAFVTMCWVVTRLIITLTVGADYVAPVNAAGWLVNILIVALVQGHINPGTTMIPAARNRALWSWMGDHLTRKGGSDHDHHHDDSLDCRDVPAGVGDGDGDAPGGAGQ